MPEINSLKLKIFYTVIIFCGHLTYGLNNSQIGTCMIDLKYLINGNGNSKESASTQAITLQTTFLCVGGLLGGAITFIYKSARLSLYLNRQLITALLLVAYGVANAAVPQLRYLALLYGAIFVTGVGGGHWAAVTITWMIEMWSSGWPRLFPPLLQAYHLVYGVGTILGPLLARPYLFGYMNETLVGDASTEAEYLEEVALRRGSLQLPYAVSGSLHGAVGLLLLLLYLLGGCWRYQKPGDDDCLVENSKEKTSIDKSAEVTKNQLLPLELPGRRTRLLLFTALTFLLFAFNNAAEFAYIFLDPFLQALGKGGNGNESGSSLVITASQAAGVSALYGTAYTVGRAATIPLAVLLSPANLLLVHYSLGVAGTVALFFTCTTSTGSILLIQLNTALVAFALSALSSLFNYVAQYSVVDDRATALYSVALMTPSIFTPLLMGALLEAWPPVLLVFEAVALLGASLLYLLIRTVLLRGVSCEGEVGGKEKKISEGVQEGAVEEEDGGGGGEEGRRVKELEGVLF